MKVARWYEDQTCLLFTLRPGSLSFLNNYFASVSAYASVRMFITYSFTALATTEPIQLEKKMDRLIMPEWLNRIINK